MINTKNKKFILKIALIFFITSPGYVKAFCIDDVGAKPFNVYVVPMLTASQTYTSWAPILEHVGKTTGVCFKLIVPTSIPQFEIDLGSGKPDFVFMNPYHMAMKWRNQKYIPLVASSVPIYGVLIVKKDSKYLTLQDLNNSKVAFPAPNAFAASLLIRSMLAYDKIQFEAIYVKTHSNVYRSVARGELAAGGGIQSTLWSEPPELRDELRVLAETKRYTAHPFSANSRIPEIVQKRVQSAFLDLANTSEGAELLSRIQMIKPISVTYSTNYQSLEELKLEKFVVKSAE